MPSVGQQFDFDRFPQAMRGGMRVYPYGGILSGVTVGTTTIAAGTLTIPVAAGIVRLDGKKYNLAGANVTQAGVANGSTVRVPLFVLPTRANPVVAAAVAPGAAAPPTGGVGSYRLHAVDMGEYFKLINFYKYEGGAWKVHDVIFDPPTLDFGNLPHNEIVGATLGTVPEKMIYQKDASVPFVSQPAAHYVRYDSSLHFATVTAVVDGSGALTSATVEYKEVEIPM